MEGDSLKVPQFLRNIYATVGEINGLFIMPVLHFDAENHLVSKVAIQMLGSQGSILIVDDEARIRWFLHRKISKSGDKYTLRHSRGVTEIALRIGQQLSLSPDQLDDLRWGALLHDVGKIAVEPSILNKPGELNPDEYRHIMTHVTVGPDLVKPFVNDRVVEIISHHHDHYDGSGLNQVVAGEDIPLGARIVAVADAFNAMTSDRPYRAARPKNRALDEMTRCSGTQFDPIVAGVLLKVAAAHNINS